MSKRIDLERLTWDFGFVTNEDVLALVAAVRAARAFDQAITSSLSSGFDLKAARLDMHAALSPFTDSSESSDSAESASGVRSDA